MKEETKKLVELAVEKVDLTIEITRMGPLLNQAKGVEKGIRAFVTTYAFGREGTYAVRRHQDKLVAWPKSNMTTGGTHKGKFFPEIKDSKGKTPTHLSEAVEAMVLDHYSENGGK